MNIRTRVHEQIARAMKALGLPEIAFSVEYPALPEHGDVATNVAMVLARAVKRPPMEIAQEIAGVLRRGIDSAGDAIEQGGNRVDKSDMSNKTDRSGDIFERVEVVKPGFINFFLTDVVVLDALTQMLEEGAAYGTRREEAGLSRPSDDAARKTIIIEYSSPNTNKPLHLGHLRNNFLGMALSNVLETRGYRVLRTEIVNDRGIHICKSMLAYQLWGNGETPESEGLKGDFLVGKYYVLFSQEEKRNPAVLEQAQELLRKWEAGDPDVRALWKKMNGWVEGGIRQTYTAIGSRFDFRDWESEIYDKGKQVVLEALQRGRVERVEGGAVAIDLSAQGLGGRDDSKKILIRSDGTAMYITQDIYLALKRWEAYRPYRALYVVANEQDYHFKVLFTVLPLLGYPAMAGKFVHVSYGMVELPEGKMKSREGTVVDADTLIAQVELLARDEIRTRDVSLSDAELDQRAHDVALAALKFYLLKVDPSSRVVYNPKESLDFEGDTGVYVQYTYARLSSILAKAERIGEIGGIGETPVVHPDQIGMTTGRVGERKMSTRERYMLTLMMQYGDVVERVASEYKPHYLAEYLLHLAREVNAWYADAPVLKADPAIRAFRLNVVRAARQVIGSGLQLLGITPLERM